YLLDIARDSSPAALLVDGMQFHESIHLPLRQTSLQHRVARGRFRHIDVANFASNHAGDNICYLGNPEGGGTGERIGLSFMSSGRQRLCNYSGDVADINEARLATAPGKVYRAFARWKIGNEV